MSRSYRNPNAALLSAAIIGISAVAGATSAMATERFAQASPSQQEAPNYSPAKLKAFAKAALQVRQINMNAQQKVQSASSENERKSIQQEVFADLKKAVSSNGMTLAEYNEIASSAQNDEELRQKINAYMMKMQESGEQ